MQQRYDVTLRLVMAGASGSGKTSLLLQYVDQTYMTGTLTSVGIDFRVKTLLLSSGKRARVQLWDTAGQERFRFITTNYWRGAEGVIFVYDMTDLQGFQQVETWAAEAKQHGMPGTSGVLLANKSDLDFRRTVTRDQGERLAARLGLRYFEVSAKSGLQVMEAFRGAIEMAAESKMARELHAQIEAQEKRLTVRPKLADDDNEGRQRCAPWCSIM